ncbi:hypothetical protein B0H10DRAFT_2014932 [Mycena sp. CBHHK59/15]|nr:hypothetical protein B0H10DRAFT_2014932 [Mycena sp. CBHHK59/15]
MNPILKLKLEAIEAIEDDKRLLANAKAASSDLDSSESDATSAYSCDSESEYEELEHVSPLPERKVENTKTEAELDGDFERLVQNIKLNEDPSSAGILSKEWDFEIHEQDGFLENLRAASGVGRQRRKGARRAGSALSFQTKAMIGEGNQAYVDGDLSTTIRIMLEVIPWAVLAQCYDDQMEPLKALQLRIMGAHLKNDADEWDRLARQSKELGYGQQALYCWGKGYNLDPNNVGALWDRAILAKELGDLKTTRTAFLGILACFPHDLNILSELRAILIDLGELQLCADLFQEAFDYYRDSFPSGIGRSAASGLEVPRAGFALLEILVLADLYNTLGEHERAIDVIRKGCRWLQGRSEQSDWDLCSDDREFDFESRDIIRAVDGIEDIDPGYHDIDVNARHRLAIARIKLGEIEEGKLHADVVLSQDILDYAPLFTEIADTYFEQDLFADARCIYELLGAKQTTSSVDILLQTAACLRMIDELQEAANVYEQVRKADPSHNEAKMKLAEVYEILDEPRKALELVYEVIDSRKRRPKETIVSSVDVVSALLMAPIIQEKGVKPRRKGPASRPQNLLSNAELRDMEAQKETEVMQSYERLKQLWPRMLRGEIEPKQEWLLEAEKLIEAFRETRRLFSTAPTFRGMFPARRSGPKIEEVEEDRILCRLQLDLAHDTTARKTRSGDKCNRVDVFRGVGFQDWLRLFIQYCFILTQRGDYEHADEILRHLLLSNAYQLSTSQDSIRIALLTCASTAGRYPFVVEQSRKIVMGHQFHNEPLRIMIAALGSGLHPTDAFLSTTLQKYIFREMKLLDAAANDPDILVWSQTGKRFSLNAVADDTEEDDGDAAARPLSRKKVQRPQLPDIAKNNNPVVVALYGQMCLVTKSFQSAIFYLLLAYDYCQADPMICLCLTVASIGRAMQRQCDNRQHLITQAMAFLSRYRDLRGADGHNFVEIEFNVGRAFHQLGLFSHAARHYECSITAATKNGADVVCAREAAYNLSMIYVSTGASELATALYQRWLSL